MIPRRKEYPKQLNINGEEWKVKFVNIIDKDIELHGQCDPGTRTIYIRNKQSEVERCATFIHEILHAFEAEYEIKISHKAIYQLEHAMMDFILVNF